MRKILAVVLCYSFGFICSAYGDDVCTKAKNDFNEKAKALLNNLEREHSVLKGTCKNLYKHNKDCDINVIKQENERLRKEVDSLEQKALEACNLGIQEEKKRNKKE
jgi:hypothetical protein